MAKKYSQVEIILATQIVEMLQTKIDLYFGKDDKKGEILTREISVYGHRSFKTLLEMYTLSYIFQKESTLVDWGRSAYTLKEIQNIQEQLKSYIEGWIRQWTVFTKHNPNIPVDSLTAKRSKVFPWIVYDEDTWQKLKSYLTTMYHEVAKQYALSCIYQFLTEEEAAAARSKFPGIIFLDPDDLKELIRQSLLQKMNLRYMPEDRLDPDFFDSNLQHLVSSVRSNKATLDYEYADYPEAHRQIIKQKHGQFIDYCYDQVFGDRGYINGSDNENLETAISNNDIPGLTDFSNLIKTRASTEAYWGLYTSNEDNTLEYSPAALESVIDLNKKLVDDVVIPTFLERISEEEDKSDSEGADSVGDTGTGSSEGYILTDIEKGVVQTIKIAATAGLTELRDKLFTEAQEIAHVVLTSKNYVSAQDLSDWHNRLTLTGKNYTSLNANISVPNSGIANYTKVSDTIDMSFVRPIVNAAEGYLADLIIKGSVNPGYDQQYLSGGIDSGTNNISKISTTAISTEALVLIPNKVLTTGRKDVSAPGKDFVIRPVKTTGDIVAVDPVSGSRTILPIKTTRTLDTSDLNFTNLRPVNDTTDLGTINMGNIRPVNDTTTMNPLAKLIARGIKNTTDLAQAIGDKAYRINDTRNAPVLDMSTLAKRVVTSRDQRIEEDVAGRVVTTSTPDTVEILSTSAVRDSKLPSLENIVLDGSPASAFVPTYNTFSGQDMVVSVSIKLDSKNTINKIIGSFQTISYSIFNDKAPVRVLGDMNPRRFVFGPRLIAGSIVMTVFDKHWMRELLGSYIKIKSATEKYFLLDELPEMDITISMANEYGQAAKIALYGVTFVKEGQIMSINDIYTENTCSFFARNIDYQDSVQRLLENNKRTDVIPVRIVSIQNSGSTETVAVNPKPKESSDSSDSSSTPATTDPEEKVEKAPEAYNPKKSDHKKEYETVKKRSETGYLVDNKGNYVDNDGNKISEADRIVYDKNNEYGDLVALRDDHIETRVAAYTEKINKNINKLLKKYNITENDTRDRAALRTKLGDKKYDKFIKKYDAYRQDIADETEKIRADENRIFRDYAGSLQQVQGSVGKEATCRYPAGKVVL